MTHEEIEKLRDKCHLGLITQEDFLLLLQEVCLQQMNILVLEGELMKLRNIPRLEQTYSIDVYQEKWGR